LDFGKLICDPELLKKINKEQPQSVEEMKKMVKGNEGLKMEFTNPVIIDFKLRMCSEYKKMCGAKQDYERDIMAFGGLFSSDRVCNGLH